MESNKAYEVCKKHYRKKTTPKYVKIQMRDFMRICEGKNKKYIIVLSIINVIRSFLLVLQAFQRQDTVLLHGQSKRVCPFLLLKPF